MDVSSEGVGGATAAVGLSVLFISQKDPNQQPYSR